MNLSQIQHEHKVWLKHNFPEQTIEETFMGMVEEMGELGHHLLKRKQGIRGGAVNHSAEIKDACADLVIFMLDLADKEGFDLMHTIEDTWVMVRERDWVAHPENGVTA